MAVKSALREAGRDVHVAIGGSRRNHQIAVGVLMTATAAVYAVFSLVLNYTFRTHSYDLVIFDQAVRSYAHFQPGISIIKGVHNGFGQHFSVLGDHWSPIIATIAPFYWLFNSPDVLLVAQPVLFALAIPSLWIFTRRAFGGGVKATAAAYLVSVAYALSWPIAQASQATFHEVAFAPVLTAVALERLQAGRLRSALIALAGLCLVKEDMGLLIAGIGIFLAVSGAPLVPRQRIVGAALFVAGVLDTWLTAYVLIPAFGGRAGYYWAYTAFGDNPQQAALRVITDPRLALHVLITPGVKLDTMLWLFGAFCFLPLASPISLAAAPLLLERMLGSKFPNWWSTSYQYNAFLVVVLVCAAVDGAARLARASRGAAGPARRAPRLPGLPSAAQPAALAFAIAMCAVSLTLVPHFALGKMFQPSFYRRNAQDRAAAAAVALIPSGVTVEAISNIGPHLTARDTVLIWDQQPRWAPWVVAGVYRRASAFKSLRAQKQRVALLEHSGYRVVFDREGYIVLHRDGSGPGSGRARGATG